MGTTASDSQTGSATGLGVERPRAAALALAAAMASRVLELEALVNSQAASIESLEAQVSTLGAALGRRWDFGEGDGAFGDTVFGDAVRHRRCRGR